MCRHELRFDFIYRTNKRMCVDFMYRTNKRVYISMYFLFQETGAWTVQATTYHVVVQIHMRPWDARDAIEPVQPLSSWHLHHNVQAQIEH